MNQQLSRRKIKFTVHDTVIPGVFREENCARTAAFAGLEYGIVQSDRKQKPGRIHRTVAGIENIELFYTENEKIKVKMNAELAYEFENGDREFPKGVYMEFFDEFGQLESTLKANHAYFFKKEDQWRGRGAVEVKNVAKANQLNTEELF